MSTVLLRSEMPLLRSAPSLLTAIHPRRLSCRQASISECSGEAINIRRGGQGVATRCHSAQVGPARKIRRRSTLRTAQSLVHTSQITHKVFLVSPASVGPFRSPALGPNRKIV